MDVDIDWNYLLERLERLLDMGEEHLSRQLAEWEPDPEAFRQHYAFRWQRDEPSGFFTEVTSPDIPDLADLLGIDDALKRMRRNTLQFVRSLPANNVLLWGERGGGKSSAVKGMLGEFGKQGLRMVEVRKEDFFQLPEITAWLRQLPYRFILFCDDLSFGENEVAYRELETLLEGGLEARPDNVLVYATSNSRHPVPERPAEKTGGAEIRPEEEAAEKLPLADCFGVTLGFHPMDQATYLAITRHLARKRGLAPGREQLEREALHWARDRGARSGRVARQFIDDLAGQLALRGAASKDPA
ncbi:ATP-binding protein [uncultured Desulfuromonas sp.]|uniref:ATP-binding protein n=1 Tax=uncultured Desulfuromonas sp. TaxID=181013 RepID=UPI002609EFF7|nr:ATP-binding protein [uncultured Desulfuromonas sp.]